MDQDRSPAERRLNPRRRSFRSRRQELQEVEREQRKNLDRRSPFIRRKRNDRLNRPTFRNPT